MISAWRAGAMTRSPDISMTGSPGSRRMNEKAMSETPRNVGIRMARRPSKNRNMIYIQYCSGGQEHPTAGQARLSPGIFAYFSLVSDIDAVEAVNTDRVLHIAGYLGAHRDEFGRVIERVPW